MGSEESNLQAGSLLAPLKQKASHWRWGENPSSCPTQILVPSLEISFFPPHPQPRIPGLGVKCGISHCAGAGSGLEGNSRGWWDPQLGFHPNHPSMVPFLLLG